MRNTPFEPCLPTPAKQVPSGPDWVHEIKYDGYRLIVHREGKRVRLFTRNGHDWTDRYLLIVEAALWIRSVYILKAKTAHNAARDAASQQ